MLFMNDGGLKRRKNKNAHLENWTFKDIVSSQSSACAQGCFYRAPLSLFLLKACCTNTSKLGYFNTTCIIVFLFPFCQPSTKFFTMLRKFSKNLKKEKKRKKIQASSFGLLQYFTGGKTRLIFMNWHY